MDAMINSSFSKFIIAVLYIEKESVAQMQVYIDEMSDIWYNKIMIDPARCYMRNQKPPFEITDLYPNLSKHHS